MPASHAHDDRAGSVREMFGAVAPRYDLLNHLLSAGLDYRWRQRAACLALEAGRKRPRVVDVCCGTGDLAAAVLRQGPGARVVGVDFSRPMLARARAKFRRAGLDDRATLLEADALALPLPDGCADAATCAFGLRNLPDRRRGLAEMVRVVRPGGRVVVLEFHRPAGRGAMADLFSLYFHRILPRLGGWVSGGGHGGYAYLVASIEAFGPPEQTAAALGEAGLLGVGREPLPGGIASLYGGTRPR